jgi:hypothetical protein
LYTVFYPCNNVAGLWGQAFSVLGMAPGTSVFMGEVR